MWKDVTTGSKLGYSPDAIISSTIMSDGTKGLVEVKCPFSKVKRDSPLNDDGFFSYLPQLVGALVVVSEADWIDLVYWRGSADQMDVWRLDRTSQLFVDAWEAMREPVFGFCKSVMEDVEPKRAPWQLNMVLSDLKVNK